jgi:ubiquinone/menaquinone biosynthesis C-methylase UbiE
MSNPLAAAKLKAETAYNAAADNFDAEPLGFWARYGRRTVERLRLRHGAHVLDVGCGTGASALPAAQAVGPEGRVLAVDLAGELLKLGQAKAQTAGLRCVEFCHGDMTDLGFPDRHFDAVVCVFGIFFVPDMEHQVGELWRMVRPGGQLAITTWGARFLSPAYEVWLEAVRRVRPDLSTAFNPWDRITTPDAVYTLLHAGGAQRIDVAAEDGYQALRRPEDFWTIALGSGLRWTIDQIGAELAREVKHEIVDRLAAAGVDRVETNVIYAIGKKPPRAGLTRRCSHH